MPPAESLGATTLRPAPADGYFRRALAHVRTPLHRDGYALILNSAFTAAAGLVYWIVAANAYSAHSLGVNAALISSMMFLAGLASLNLPNFLVRFLPQAGRRTAPMVAWSYLATGLMAGVAAIVFLAGIEAWAPRLRFLHDAPGMQAWFVVATIGWCVFTIQDGALTAIGRAVWVPVENAVFSIAKLALVAAIASTLPLYGVFVSWTAAMVAVVIVVNAVMFGRLMRREPRIVPAAGIETQPAAGFGRYFIADYTGAMAWLASINLLPVVVTAVAGATSNAYFALAWAVAFPLYAVAANVGTSLTLHGSTDGEALPLLVRKAVRQALFMVVPAVLILLVGAPYALSLFGHEYAEHGTTLLRLLALGALPNIVLALAVAVARVERRLRGAVIALMVQAALSLGLVAPLIHAMGVVGAGVAWLTSQCVVAAGLLIAARVRCGPSGRTLAASARAATADALSGGWARRARTGKIARQIASEMDARDAPQAVRTDSDVVVFLTESEPRLAVKIACSDAGAGALAAQREALSALADVRGLNGFGALLPRVLDHGTLDGCRYLVERALPGVDGRGLVRRGCAPELLDATAAEMAQLYAATARTETVDAALLGRLVNDRIDRIAAAHSSDVSVRLEGLRTGLISALLARRAVVARTHGDLWLGNVLFDPDPVRPSVTGVVDWEASRAEDMPAVDLAHLVLATRCAIEGREIAEVVGPLLDESDSLSADELALIEPYLHDRIEPRDLVLLAWLQHVSQRVAQSTLHHRGRWMRRNVDPVLARFG
jgi:O-antigen/teichoic acid export membrane protein/aminoglycoside phosphotransferase